MNIYDLIKDGFDRKKLLYDGDSPYKISIRLLNLMILEMPSIDKFIFSDDLSLKADILDIFQKNSYDLNAFLPEKLSEYKIMGRSIEFIDGFSIIYGKDGKYLEYYTKALKGYFPKYRSSLVLGINSSCHSCILGYY